MKRKLTPREMEARLQEAEGIIGALRNHEVDAVIGSNQVAVVRRKDIEEALSRTHEELERRVDARTAELADANQRLREIIAEQQRTRQRLEESERKYRELVECANSIIMRRDTEGCVTFLNEFAQRFFGFNEGEILDGSVLGTIVPEIDSTVADRAAEVCRRPEDYPAMEAESICRDGRRVWISWTHRPICDSGRVVEILSIGNDITPLKRVEAALKETERRLLQAQQISHVGNWEWDVRGGTLWWSDEGYRLYGLEPGQIEPSHETFLSFVHPEDRERIVNMIQAAMEKRRGTATDFRVVRADGQVRVMHCDAEVMVDAEGDVQRVMGTTQDITEQEQARRQLEQYACQLRDHAELLDLAHDMIFVHDMEGRIVFWNHGAERKYGWTRQEALGQASYKLLRTEFSEPLIRITARIIKDGWWEGELVHTTRDGRKMPVATRWALRRDRNGRPTAILEIDNDITEHKRAEREMSDARRFAENIINTVQECLVVLDSQLRVVSANRSFYETFGLTPGQVEGELFHMLSGGWRDVSALGAKLGDVLLKNTSLEGFEIECHAGISGPEALLLGARPIHEQGHGTDMILLVIEDITLRKRQEREILADRQQLSSLTEELMLIEDRQRRQIATTLHDSIGQSLAFAKRELSVLRQGAPAGMQDSLSQICGEIDDAIKQTRDLTFELSPSTLHTLGLQAAIEELAEQFTDCQGFVCCVRADERSAPVAEQVRSMLYRAVRELLVNVAKHAQARNVSITIMRDERRIQIAVEDDGKGFDPAILSSGRARERGFGIYSLSERLTRIGGEVTVDSTEGKGTKVTLVAPLNPGHEWEQEPSDVRRDLTT